MDIKSCVIRSWKNDISELCSSCSLKNEIEKDLNERVLVDYLAYKELFSSLEYKDYLKSEEINAKATAHSMFLKQNNGDIEDGYLHNINETYLFNKERIKLINNLLSTVESNQLNQPKKDHITNKQKEVIDFFINEGYLDSHVFRFLTSPEVRKKEFYMVSERVFTLHLNKFHGREFKENYRYSRNIQIPEKMMEDFSKIYP